MPESKRHFLPSPLSRTPWPRQPHYQWVLHPTGSTVLQRMPASTNPACWKQPRTAAPLLSTALLLGPGRGDRGSPRECSFSLLLLLISRMQTPERQPAPAQTALLVSGTSGNQISRLAAAAPQHRHGSARSTPPAVKSSNLQFRAPQVALLHSTATNASLPSL